MSLASCGRFLDSVVKLNTTGGCFEFHIRASEYSHLDTTTDGSNSSVISLFIGGHLSLLADSPLACKGLLRQSPRILMRHINRVKRSVSLKEYILKLARLGDFLSKLNDTGKSQELLKTPEGRELSKSIISREFLTYLDTRDPKLLQFMLSFLWFGKKMHYVDPEFDAAAFRSWQKVEDRLSGLTFDADVLVSLKHIVTLLLGSERLDFDLFPRFGPGSVAERDIGSDIVLKANRLQYDRYLDRAFFRGHYGSNAKSALGESGFDFTKVIPNHWDWKESDVSTHPRVARLYFVPKNIKTARTICMEPNTVMFFQQAILASLKRRIAKRLAGKFIKLEDQTRNRDMAIYGSRTSLVDTIDLSAASDSVHVDLVRGIFPRGILYYLLASRTSRVLHGGQQISVKKFAPMGSALCFPVQCIVFTAVSILAAIADECGCDEGSLPCSEVVKTYTRRAVDGLFRDKPGKRLNPHWYEPLVVYGDDICVDTRLTSRVTSLLASLGFQVNLGKSFTGDDHFRESCGVFVSRGVDVTPVLHRVQHFRGRLNAAAVASMSDMANRAFRAGYSHLRKYLVRTLLYGDIEGVRKTQGVNPFFFVSPPEGDGDRETVLEQLPPALTMWSTAGKINRHLKWAVYGTDKVRNTYQRDECQSLRLVTKDTRRPTAAEKPAYEAYGYLSDMRARRSEWIPEFSTGFAHDGVPKNARLVRRWIPA